MIGYLELLKRVVTNGQYRQDRTGVGTYALFGAQLRYNLLDPDPFGSFPLLTTKHVHLKSIIHELLWFLKGSTNVKDLQANGVTIWDEWASPDGDLGRIYGAQWCDWRRPDGSSLNQIDAVIEQIQKNPYSRRHLVTAWNPGELDQMALPPCHVLFQFYVDPIAETLSCQLYQRSADIFLGMPFNIASYALLTMMIAHVCGLKAAEFIHTLGDVHLYVNHLEAANIQLSRSPRSLPSMKLNPAVRTIRDFTFKDFELIGYNPHPPIPAPIAV